MNTENNHHLNQLNSAQEEAVKHINGPLLVLAGAGTGKTKVLTSRIAHLIATKNALPSQILAVTFTNKAAKEMVERVEKILGYEVPGMYIGTFHSISARILRKNAELLGLTSSFNIIDMDDQLRLVKRILAELNIDTDQVNPKAVVNQISLWKDKAIKASDVDDIGSYHGNYYDAVKQVYKLYNDELQRSNSCDFGDLILHVINLLASNEACQNYYNKKFKYILVDEYQDTNVSQYLWLRLFAQGHNNICCVGDDDQSIYGFRGAEIENILRFEKDFNGAKIVKLEQNYRSTAHILNAASKLINTNQKRHGKTLFTESEGGKKITILSNWDDNAESNSIIQEIETLKIRQHKLSNIAILVRAFFQTRSIEEALLNEAIPYKIVGGLRFYERKEIKDIIAYLRVVNSDSDNLALERIINVPKRALGAAAFAKCNDYSRTKDVSIYTAISELLKNSLVTGKAKAGLEEFTSLINDARQMLQNSSLKDLAKFIIERSGYEEMLKASKEVNIDTKLENLREFCEALSEFHNLDEFLEHVSLVNELQDQNSEDSVNILTLHSAKGLEFDTVFLTGWEEGIFPHQRSLEESGDKGLEEERRLAYVGITRARKKLYISYANNRRIYNKWQVSTPSRFLRELPDEAIELKGSGTRFNNSYQKKTSSFNTTSAAKFKVGDNVIHTSFGEGNVKSLIGDVVEVNFESGKCRFVTANSLKSNCV